MVRGSNPSNGCTLGLGTLGSHYVERLAQPAADRMIRRVVIIIYSLRLPLHHTHPLYADLGQWLGNHHITHDYGSLHLRNRLFVHLYLPPRLTQLWEQDVLDQGDTNPLQQKVECERPLSPKACCFHSRPLSHRLLALIRAGHQSQKMRLNEHKPSEKTDGALGACALG